MQQLDPPPTLEEVTIKNQRWVGWLKRVHKAISKNVTYTATLTPASVAANATSEQTFTVTGLTTDDVVTVNKPSYTAGIVIGNARVSAANTLAITFGNHTAAPIVPPSEIYKIKATRL